MLLLSNQTQLLRLLLLLVSFGLFLGQTWLALASIHWLYLCVGVMVATVATLTLLGIIYANSFFPQSVVVLGLNRYVNDYYSNFPGTW